MQKTMESIIIPNPPKITEEGENAAKIEIKPCYPGYGATLGNALRRVLLSSLAGYAITSVKIRDVEHEFSGIEGVLEDVVEIILNLKKIRFQLHTEGPVTLLLKKAGEGKITAADFEKSSDVEVVTPDAYIATITKKDAEFDMEVEISKGIGYVPTEERTEEQKEIGKIHIDAIFTPIRKVSYSSSNIRVGKQTNYNKIDFVIETDGSITPENAFFQAVDILNEQFQGIAKKEEPIEEILEEKEVEEEPIDELPLDIIKEPLEEDLKKPVDQIGLSTRTSNALLEANIKTVKQLIKKSEDQILETEGLGNKAVTEINDVLAQIGLTLR